MTPMTRRKFASRTAIAGLLLTPLAKLFASKEAHAAGALGADAHQSLDEGAEQGEEPLCSTSGSYHGKFKKPVTVTSTSISGADLDNPGRTIVLNFVTSGPTCWGDVSEDLISCVFPMSQRIQVLNHLDAGKKIEIHGVGSSDIDPAHWEV